MAVANPQIARSRYPAWTDGGVSTIQVPVEQLAVLTAELILQGSGKSALQGRVTEAFDAMLRIRTREVR
ncbi:MAG: hypothetical protein HKN18_10035 [Silicimonas sp.]|nr:hypothetical protein [Silicimonas sp.]